MISGKFLHRSNLFFALLLSAACLSAPDANAQQGGYAPPPMFDDAPAPMVRPQIENGYIVEPKTSSPPVAAPSVSPAERPVAIAPRVSVDPDAKRPARLVTPKAPQAPVVPTAPIAIPAPPVVTAPAAPVIAPPQQARPVMPVAPPPAAPVSTPAPAPVPKPPMMKPIVEKEVYIKREKPPLPAKKPDVAPAPEKPAETVIPAAKPAPKVESEAEVKKPAPVLTAAPSSKNDDRTQPVPPKDGKNMPAARVTNKGVLSGPKNMPSVPTQDVDGQVIFEPETAPISEPTILERHQQQQTKETATEKAETLVPIVPRPKDGVAPASFESAGQDALKRSIPFAPGQIGLKPEEADPVAAGIVKELDSEDKQGWRVQIRSHATPHGTGLSSDRRIALSRALSLRSTLITQGVAPDLIDVLAEGVESTKGQAGDRIDIYLYGPRAK